MFYADFLLVNTLFAVMIYRRKQIGFYVKQEFTTF